MIQSPYQVGGSLSTDAPTYVKRQADDDLYNALRRGEFCYVLNARQMGKSSLMVRTQHRLQQEGCYCAAIDLSVIGSEEITPLQWYKGIITSLSLEFDILGEFNLKSWWKAEEDLSFIQRFSQFIDLLLEVYLPQKQIFIFIDEVDSILHLNFSVDDFFALIRSFYNQRAINPIYKRISFSISGVATPSDLIQDKRRTPFNIGTAIELKGFTWDEAQPLVQNFKIKSGCSDLILKEILFWTKGQPFLTQKLCDLVVKASLNSEYNGLEIKENKEKEWVNHLVRSQILENWEAADEPEHLKTIQYRLLNNINALGRILGIYQQILSEPSSKIELDDSREKLELILSGLVIKVQGHLKVKNPIYAAIFNLQWIQSKLDQIRPYSQLLEAWKLSNYQDDSRLLRGKALREAQQWAEGKSLSNLDYRFLGNSQKYEDQEIQKTLQAERAKEIEARLLEERKIVKVQKFFLEKVRQETEARLHQEQTKRDKDKEINRLQLLLLKGTSGAILVLFCLIVIVFWQYFKSLNVQNKAQENEITALLASAEAFLNSHQDLDSLVSVLQANKNIKSWESNQYKLQQKTKQLLEKAIFNIHLSNYFSGHNQRILGMAFSREGEALETFISASADQTIKQWNREGQLLRTLVNNNSLQAIGFSPIDISLPSNSGNRFAVGDRTNLIKLYNEKGGIIQEIEAAQANVTQIALSGNQQTLAAVSGKNTVQLWTQTGTLLGTLSHNQGLIHSLALSANGEILATGGEDNQVKLWNRQGRLLKTLPGYFSSVWQSQQTIVFSPNNQLIAIADAESIVKLYDIKGTLLTTFTTNQSVINSIAFSPDSQMLAIAGLDNTIQLWSIAGNLLEKLAAHHLDINHINFSPDGKTLASTASDGTIYFWKLHHPLQQTFMRHDDLIKTVKFSADGQQLITFCHHDDIKYWQRDGTLLQTIDFSEIKNINPDSKNLLRLLYQADPRSNTWTNNPAFLNRITNQVSWIKQVAVNSEKPLIATLNSDNIIQFWNALGELQQQIDPDQTEILEIAFSPDNEVFGFSSNYQIELWNLLGELSQILVSPQAKIQAWRFSPDGQTIIAMNAAKQIMLWNQQGELLSTILTETEAIIDLDISSDGQLLAIIDRMSPDTIQLWNRQGELLQTLYSHQTQFSEISFSPTANVLASATHNGEVTLWDIQSILNTDLYNLACDWVKDYLKTNKTREDRQRNICNAVR
ncbi:MAG: AAA-like domain-containing protein [Microcoleaceae cyanobacterium]